MYLLLASEQSERDTIRGVHIWAGAVRIYMYMEMFTTHAYSVHIYYVCYNSSACYVYKMWALGAISKCSYHLEIGTKMF